MISIVIPTWNGRHLLERSLPALLHQVDSTTTIIVVDNGSSDGTCDWIEETYPDVRRIGFPENRGFSAAVNEGIRAAGTSDVILVNNDTLAEPEWLNRLVNAASTYTEYHMFASRVLLMDPPDHLDTIGDGFTIAGFGYKIAWLHHDDDVPRELREVFGASGCAVYIRRCVFDRIGVFDEDFFAFGEDLDFSFRARLAGYRILSVPDARIHHAVRATAVKDHTLFWYHRNIIWLILKNFPWQLLCLYMPHLIAQNILVCATSILRGWFSVYVRSMRAAIQGIPAVLVKRRIVQKQRRIPVRAIRDVLDANWIGIHIRLHRAKKLLFSR
ncbi:MAG TPA: glycosyltransferase family 2 protein [bacterium]|nr:glycosyltransferase family 2 protein [bacterium]